MFQIATLMMAPLIGSVLSKIGRKNCIIIGFSISMLASIGFALLSHVPDE
jgi:MFS family permease